MLSEIVLSSFIMMYPVSPCICSYDVCYIDQHTDILYPNFVQENSNKAKLNENIEKLNKISQYENNWNGYGAKPISQQLIFQVKDLLNNLKTQPDLFPTACESIQLEYEDDDGNYLEIELFDNNIVHIFRINNGQELEKEIRFDINEINDIIGEF